MTAMAKSTALSVIISALILGASLIAAALLIRSPLDRTVTELAALREAVEAAPAAPPGPAARPGRPDPNKRYSIDTEGAPVRGPASAKVSIVEFGDFQCPFCARVEPTLRQIEEHYGDEVRIVFKHLPLRTLHPQAVATHAAAEAAHRQGRFWEMHDAILADPRQTSPEHFAELAERIGLDLERFAEDVISPQVKGRVDADIREAGRLGVSGTPGFFINGRFLSGAKPFEEFQRVIDRELGRG